MKKPSSIQLNIPHPCTQNWDEMTPCSTGRFCAHCQKTVIDFTTWTDTALYNFFSKKTGEVCGRMLPTQMQRNIIIPYQPHSRLYRLTIALGLTLIFAETPQAFSQHKPKTEKSSVLKNTHSSINEIAIINGTVLDEHKQPLANVTIEIYQDSNLKIKTATDFQGSFIVKSLPRGNYDVIALYKGYNPYKVTYVLSTYGDSTDIQIQLEPYNGIDKRTIVSYKKRLKNCDRERILLEDLRTMPTGQIIYWGPPPGRRILDRDEINRMPY